MRKLICLISFVLFTFQAFSEKSDTLKNVILDSLGLRILTYDTSGKVILGNNLASFQIAKGFKYLNSEQAKYVLSDLWGNPPSESLGMIFPQDAEEIYPSTWAIEISYDNDGHVKDDDAAEINYDDLLEQMQDEIQEGNKMRKELGYATVHSLDWASKPYYDSKEKKLHWAKKLKFDGDSTYTLNYNIRILGKEGVLVLNAIGGIDQLEMIKEQLPQVLKAVNFEPGNTYAEFNESTDKVATYGIAGLVAGGVLAKTGILGKLGLIFAKFAKVIVLGVVALGGVVWKWITGKKDEENS